MNGDQVDETASSQAVINQRREFVGLNDSHAALLIELHDEMAAGMGASVEQVYATLRTVPSLSEKLGSKENERRVSQLFAGYVDQIFGGTYDAAYLETRRRIGIAHDRIGLGPHWFVGAFGHLF